MTDQARMDGKADRLEPPFLKRRVGAYLFQWKGALEYAHKIAVEHGCYLAPTNAEYQICKIIGDGVQIVLYPHRTTANNINMRARDEHSKDPAKAYAICRNFSTKNDSMAKLKGRAKAFQRATKEQG